MYPVSKAFLRAVPDCPKKKDKREQIRKGCVKLYEICEELSLSCHRAAWDTDEEGMWQEQYKGIDARSYEIAYQNIRHRNFPIDISENPCYYS